MQLLRRLLRSANSRPNVKPTIQVFPTTGYQRNRLSEGVKNVTDSDIKPALKRGHYAMEVDLPPVTKRQSGHGFPWPWGNGVYCSTPSKHYVAAAHPTGGHVTRLEHRRRGRHVLPGVVVHQQVQTYFTKLLGCCQQCH